MREPFSAWKAGRPFTIPPIVVACIILGFAGQSPWALVGISFGILGLFSLYFFRDPKREIPTDPDVIVSPADGTVDTIEDLDESPYYDGPCKRVSIFLSIFSVHVNRIPYDCTIREIEFKKGRMVNAMRADAADINQSNTLRLDTPKGPMTVRQITGAVARRIVCPAQIGEKYAKGEKFGMIRFGSRTDLFLPPDAEVSVTLKEKVNGGSTVIARMPE